MIVDDFKRVLRFVEDLPVLSKQEIRLDDPLTNRRTHLSPTRQISRDDLENTLASSNGPSAPRNDDIFTDPREPPPATPIRETIRLPTRTLGNRPLNAPSNGGSNLTSNPQYDCAKCPICAEHYAQFGGNAGRAVSTPCGHVMCKLCLTITLLPRSETDDNKGSCPWCRNDFFPELERRQENRVPEVLQERWTTHLINSGRPSPGTNYFGPVMPPERIPGPQAPEQIHRLRGRVEFPSYINRSREGGFGRGTQFGNMPTILRETPDDTPDIEERLVRHYPWRTSLTTNLGSNSSNENGLLQENVPPGVHRLALAALPSSRSPSVTATEQFLHHFPFSEPTQPPRRASGSLPPAYQNIHFAGNPGSHELPVEDTAAATAAAAAAAAGRSTSPLRSSSPERNVSDESPGSCGPT